MKILLCIVVLLATGCAHVASTRGVWTDARTLRLERHVDTIVRGPDSEETQFLELTVRDFKIGQRQNIPAEVPAQFSVQRFGPPSSGDSYRGYLIVRSVKDKEVVATLNLVVEASTRDKSYRQTARYRGNYTFYRP